MRSSLGFFDRQVSIRSEIIAESSPHPICRSSARRMSFNVSLLRSSITRQVLLMTTLKLIMRPPNRKTRTAQSQPEHQVQAAERWTHGFQGFWPALILAL